MTGWGYSLLSRFPSATAYDRNPLKAGMIFAASTAVATRL
jgi:hypothetical protein